MPESGTWCDITLRFLMQTAVLLQRVINVSHLEMMEPVNRSRLALGSHPMNIWDMSQDVQLQPSAGMHVSISHFQLTVVT